MGAINQFRQFLATYHQLFLVYSAQRHSMLTRPALGRYGRLIRRMVNCGTLWIGAIASSLITGVSMLLLVSRPTFVKLPPSLTPTQRPAITRRNFWFATSLAIKFDPV